MLLIVDYKVVSKNEIQMSVGLLFRINFTICYDLRIFSLQKNCLIINKEYCF